VAGDKPDTQLAPHQKKALNSALRILTRRDHSKYELVRKLKQRGFSREDIDNAISSCEKFDYINDERTAQVYIRELKRKGYGKKRIQLELNKKGLIGTRILGILDESVSETDEREGAERILTKNIKRFERETGALKRRDKIYRFLHARGFLQGVIAEILQKYDQTENLRNDPVRK
jgi:regulatory protein